MITRRLSVLAAATLVVAALSACSGGAPESPTAPSSGVGFPPRPAAVDVSAIPPCSVLSASQQKQLSIFASQEGDANVDGQRSPGCGYLSSSQFDYNTQTIPAGAETALRLPGAESIQINGFGAVRDRARASFSPRPMCQVSVDAAPGLTIRVQVAATPNGSPANDEELCRRATDLASMVMTTVVATASR